MEAETVTDFTVSARTKSIIANFSGINPSLVFKPGNVLRTISKNEDLLAIATVEEVFPREVGIHDLSKFLSIISLYKNPTIKFNEHSCTITCSQSPSHHYNYRYTSTNNILQPSEEEIELGEPIETFELLAKDLAELVKVISISKHPDVALEAKDGMLSIQALDSRNINGDVYVNHGVKGTDKTFKYVFKITKILVLMSATYQVTIYDGVTVFESSDVKYFVTAEAEI